MIKAKKKYGQNFLVDKGVINKIIQAINPNNSEKILEIGPGLGALTTQILNKIDHINVVEIDPDMIKALQEKIPSTSITIFSSNILEISNDSIAEYDKVIGNLPYYISSEILIKMTKTIKNQKELHFMLQKEVAERIASSPHSKSYGRLSVMLQYFFEIDLLFDIQPESFSPSPKVTSSLVRLIPKKNYKKVKNINNFEKLLKTSFAQKRKTIKNNLKSMLNDNDLNILGVNPQDRAEMLTLSDFVRIENYIFDKKILD
ncbi:MAG: 16S rRNA (adenine(1518)-N(6)/adenine(1519)-N(6))-dimethyltransferase RsmA [Methylophilaceae bacterium]|nr:16S rRNA (adenine(1518)-N(6)/adenine(1519)-N(6))-dimethyltransferase RsmA [Methylophilaceae bacterium]